MTTPTGVSSESTARQRAVEGLRELADFLETHPDVPVEEHGHTLLVFAEGPSDAAQQAEVDRLAAVMGVQIDDDTADGGHYTATRSFGPIGYKAVHIPSRARAEHEARFSYSRNVVVGPASQTTGKAGPRVEPSAGPEEGGRP